MRIASLILGFVGLALAVSASHAPAQTSTQPAPTTQVYRETPAGALARHLRVLATSPRDFTALIGAGKAALALGDTQSAVGFFGRAEEVSPRSPLPLAGMGAAMAADGDGQGALGYFARAQQLGASVVVMGADRGLAYDLIGRHSDAQADYRSALLGMDADEARRRLALSQAITGDKAGALQTLAPLIARFDAGATRTRAFVLALTGDIDGARRSLDSALPGSSAQMAPFLARLPSLRSDQKAAAVNLGIFPTSGQAYAYVPSPSAGPPAAAPAPRPPAAPPIASATPNTAPAASGPVQMANITPRPRAQLTQPPAPAAAEVKPRVWVQLASGPNAAALPDQFRRLKSRHKDVLEGISGYVAQSSDRARLVVGPFRSKSEANIFAEDLESVNLDAFSWTSTPGDQIRKLPLE